MAVRFSLLSLLLASCLNGSTASAAQIPERKVDKVRIETIFSMPSREHRTLHYSVNLWGDQNYDSQTLLSVYAVGNQLIAHGYRQNDASKGLLPWRMGDCHILQEYGTEGQRMTGVTHISCSFPNGKPREMFIRHAPGKGLDPELVMLALQEVQTSKQ